MEDEEPVVKYEDDESKYRPCLICNNLGAKNGHCLQCIEVSNSQSASSPTMPPKKHTTTTTSTSPTNLATDEGVGAELKKNEFCWACRMPGSVEQTSQARWEIYTPDIQTKINNVYDKGKTRVTFTEYGEDYVIIFNGMKKYGHRQYCVRTNPQCNSHISEGWQVRKVAEFSFDRWDDLVDLSPDDMGKVTKLVLRNGALSHSRAQQLVEKLEDWKILRTLDVRNNNLDESCGVAFAKELASNSTIQSVDFGKNSFGEQAGVAFGKMLETNKTIRIFIMDKNRLGEESGVAIATGIAQHPSLYFLRLSENNFADKSGKQFALALCTNTWLRVLDLRCNYLGESGTEFGDVLANNTPLRELYLSKNNVGDVSGAKLGLGLGKNTKLRVLDLTENNLTDKSGVKIGTGLETNDSLVTLNLTYNNMGESSGIALLKALTRNHTLKHFNFHANSLVSPSTIASIRFATSSTLKNLLSIACVAPSQIPVCVVGFNGVGKSRLVDTWRRTTTHNTPSVAVAVEETEGAKDEHAQSTTSGVSVSEFTLSTEQSSSPRSPKRLKRDPNTPPTFSFSEASDDETTVKISAWDFSGHVEYYLSHEVILKGCREAIFTVLFRLDNVLTPSEIPETERLFFWLRFIASTCFTPHQPPPTVFIVGNFRPDDSSNVDVAAVEWAAKLLNKAKEQFDGLLNLPQSHIYCVDCRRSGDDDMVALRRAVVDAVKTTRARPDRQVPAVCELARQKLHPHKARVSERLAAYENAKREEEANGDLSRTQSPIAPLNWNAHACGPIMHRAKFLKLILGNLKADEIQADPKFIAWLHMLTSDVSKHDIPSITPRWENVFDIVLSYLHDVGDILWFNVEGLRDTVVVNPDLFCSKILGACFNPERAGQPGFPMDSVLGDGSTVHASEITPKFTQALGIDKAHVKTVLSVLCKIGLCHRDTTDVDELFMFPGALTQETYRKPEWFGALQPGKHFIVARRFTVENPSTNIFSPGTMSQLQVWALNTYKGSHVFHGGVFIPYSASGMLAEVGIQTHRSHSRSRSTRCGQVSISTITLIVRGNDPNSPSDCGRLIVDISNKIKFFAGVKVWQKSLPAAEVAKLSENESWNMLDVVCRGFLYDFPRVLDDKEANVGGRMYSLHSLRYGAFVDVAEPALQFIPTPSTWTGSDFQPVFKHIPDDKGGAHLLALVEDGTPEFNNIQAKMRISLPTANITKIERVQNRSLWNRYYLFRADVALENGGNPNEIEAWHGTGHTSPWLICSDWKAGFDVNKSIVEISNEVDPTTGQVVPRLRNIRNKTYGTGVYLAHYAIYPDTIIPHKPNTGDNTKQMILALVTLGKNKDYKAHMPDYKAAVEPSGYHSISGTEGDMQFLQAQKSKLEKLGIWTSGHQELVDKGNKFGKQYVVHRSNMVYPEYLVTYK